MALVLVWQGVLQNFSSYVEVTTLEGAKQTLAMGPMASQIAIKQLGTNGGGFFNVNSAHPFEGGTPLANFIEMVRYSRFRRRSLTCTASWRANQKQGWTLFGAMAILFFMGVTTAYYFEAKPQSGDAQVWPWIKTAGNWREKKFAMASPTRRCGRRQRPTRHTARSTRCTIVSMPIGGLVPL